jgi:hypothetical protein
VSVCHFLPPHSPRCCIHIHYTHSLTHSLTHILTHVLTHIWYVFILRSLAGFWTKQVKLALQRQFPRSLSSEETHTMCHLEKVVDLSELVFRLADMVGIHFSEEACEGIKSIRNPGDFRFLDSDLDDLVPKAKHMNIIEHCQVRSFCVPLCECECVCVCVCVCVRACSVHYVYALSLLNHKVSSLSLFGQIPNPIFFGALPGLLSIVLSTSYLSVLFSFHLLCIIRMAVYLLPRRFLSSSPNVCLYVCL